MFSPLARDGQLLSLSSASAAGANFRYTTKVTKGVQKGRRKPFGRFSSPLLIPLIFRPIAVRAKGAYVFECAEAVPAALTLQFKYPNVAGTSFTHSKRETPRILCAEAAGSARWHSRGSRQRRLRFLLRRDNSRGVDASIQISQRRGNCLTISKT